MGRNDSTEGIDYAVFPALPCDRVFERQVGRD